MKKILNQIGETISETLISLLVASLALTMLAGAISSASKIITEGRQKLDRYYEANEADTGVIKMKEGGTVGKIQFEVTDGSFTQPGEDILYFKNPEFPVISYRKEA